MYYVYIGILHTCIIYAFISGEKNLQGPENFKIALLFFDVTGVD